MSLCQCGSLTFLVIVASGYMKEVLSFVLSDFLLEIILVHFASRSSSILVFHLKNEMNDLGLSFSGTPLGGCVLQISELNL